MGAVLWMCGGRVRKMSKRAAQDEAFVMRDVELDFNFGGCSRSMSCTKPRQSNLNASSLIDDFESLERLQSKPNRSYIPSKTPLYELDDDEDEDFRDSSVRYSRRLPPHTPTTLPELRRSLDAGTITPGGVVTRHHEDETNNSLGLNATATAVNLDLELVSGATGRTSSSLELVQEIPRTSRTRDGITGS
ncbi:MFS multidrug transporter [Coprinopsis cinerea AmutBmut pab1-1]|nr:MFS multidrug transporter [Coprinopsis cinerea AmutBmut pab1-1]